ncbi:MAG: hypothetical protein PHS14_08195 [Elusimicrobia bacterium]|nr:hypothetical protein [Elusimicrobiota bacterium]
MKRLLVLAAVLALAGLAWGQEAPAGEEKPPNLLEGHSLELLFPDAVIIIADDRAAWAWAGKAVLSIDGRASALITLPAADAPLPPRKWTGKDTLAAAGIAALAALLAGAVGYAAGTAR